MLCVLSVQICRNFYEDFLFYVFRTFENEPKRMGNREKALLNQRGKKERTKSSGLQSRSIRDCVYLCSCASCGCMFKYTTSSYSVRACVCVCVCVTFLRLPVCFFMILLAVATNFHTTFFPFICFLLLFFSLFRLIFFILYFVILDLC